MGRCLGCNKKLGLFEGYSEEGMEFCKDCFPKRKEILKKKEIEDKQKEKERGKYEREKKKEGKEKSPNVTKKTKLNKTQIKEYKKHIKVGIGEHLLTQGGKMGIIFAGIIFLLDYSGVFGGKVEGAGTYLFLGIFFGLFAGLWSWHVMKKKLKEK